MLLLTLTFAIGSFLVLWCFILPQMLKEYRFLKHTEVPDDPKNPKQPLKHCVIIGGSLGGLITAKAMSKHATQVTIIERGKYEDGKCIPAHAEQLHTLLGRGLLTVSKIFPGLMDKIIKHPSSFFFDWGSQLTWVAEGGARVPFAKGEMKVETFSIHRIFLELMMREEVQKIPNVTIHQQATMKSFIFDSSNSLRIIGVKYEKDGVEHSLKGDLVVDCGGRVAPSHHLLQTQMGIKLEKSQVRSDLNYVGLGFEFAEEDLPKKFVYYQPHPPHQLGVGMLPYDSKTASLVLIGINGAPVPKREEELEDFLKPFPEVYAAYKKATKICKFLPFKKEGSDYYHYEKTGLSGFVALGDAVTSFNPAYGQGQTNTAEGALLLDYFMWFKSHEKDWESQFQTQLAKRTTFPYLLAGGSDLRFKNTTGGGSLQKFAPLCDMLMSSMMKAGTREKYVQKTMMTAVHLFDEFVDRIFTTTFLFTIIRGNIRHSLGVN